MKKTTLQKKMRPAQAGFTLLETLVAIFIMTVAIGAAMFSAQIGLHSSIFSEQTITASYLGQEAIEYVRNIRDENKLQVRSDWLDGPSGASLESCVNKNCIVDPVNATITTCSGTCAPLNFDTSTGFYQYSATSATNQPSPFTRTVTVVPLTDPNDPFASPHEVSVTATITWGTSPGVQTYTVRENLLDW
jgi:prepilin-type N-terminal cleavage/methylation domain-containing protein